MSEAITNQTTIELPRMTVRIDRMLHGNSRTKALVSVTLADAYVVHGIRVVETDKGRCVFMPQETYKRNGQTMIADTFHALNHVARAALVDAVNEAYEQARIKWETAQAGHLDCQGEQAEPTSL